MIFYPEFFRRERNRKTIKKAKNHFLVKSLIGTLVFCLIGSFFVGKVLGEDKTDKLKEKIWINEIAWMGSSESTADEWIELKNATNEDIDLDGIEVENGSESGGNLVIHQQIEIPARGFYLISNYDNDDANSDLNVAPDYFDTGLSLNDNGEDLILYEIVGDKEKIIDKAMFAESGWSAGNKDSKRTMERTENGEWQTSKKQGGTPGEENSDGLEEDKEEDAPDLCNSEKHPEILNIEINEILPNPDKDDENEQNRVEWVELHNPGKEEVLLNGCYIGDE
ncbi:MAG: lamin tail domain-containing protein, partial [Candidatus Moraniibacteriota bacterium]